jgi:threonine dehydratase
MVTARSLKSVARSLIAAARSLIAAARSLIAAARSLIAAARSLSSEVADHCSEVADHCSEVADRCSEVADRCSEVADRCSEVADRSSEVSATCREVSAIGDEVAASGSELASSRSTVATDRSPVAPGRSEPATSATTGLLTRTSWPSYDAPIPDLTIDRAAITATALAIAPHVRVTPLLELAGRDLDLPDIPSLHLKLELLQHAGSFKTRGAFANLLARPAPPIGVVAASGGNHGAAVAYAAQQLGIPATIYVPSVSSPAKLARIRGYGARLEVTGHRYADALAASEVYAATTNALPIHAFDDPHTLLGQGTLARELDLAAGFDTVLVAVGGGGLIGGIAAWYRGRTRVVGVEPELAPTLSRALAAGAPVDADAGGIAADSLAPRRVGERMFPIARAYVESVVLVPDDAIAATQRLLWQRATLAVEPGGAAALAALVSRRYVAAPGERVCVIISGGNTAAVDFDR